MIALVIIVFVAFVVHRKVTMGYTVALKERDGLTDSQAVMENWWLRGWSSTVGFFVPGIIAFLLRDPDEPRLTSFPVRVPSPGVLLSGSVLTVVLALSYAYWKLGRWPIGTWRTPSFLTTGRSTAEIMNEMIEQQRQRKRDRTRRKIEENRRKYGKQFPD